MARSVRAIGSWVAAGGAFLTALGLPSLGHAHGHLVSPPARTMDTGLMAGPCGEIPPGTNRTTFASGETVTVTWALEANHGGTIRIAFSPGDDTGFGAGILADGIPDEDGSQEGQVDVQLPMCWCEACTIQFRQVLPSGNAAYYSCADVELVAPNPDVTPECELSAGTGGGSSGGAATTATTASGASATSDGPGTSSTSGGAEVPDPPPATGGCRVGPPRRLTWLAPLLALVPGRRRRATLAITALSAGLGGCLGPAIPYQDVDRDTDVPTGAGSGGTSAGSSGGSSGTTSGPPTSSTSTSASTSSGTATSTSGTTTPVPEECGGLGGTGESAGTTGPWLELTHQDVLLTDGSTLEMICGAQGGTMFVLEAWFGGFEPTAYSVPMVLDMELPGFPVGPAGSFHHEERPMDLNCTASEPDGVLILVLPPDEITDPYTLQGASGTVSMSIETPEGTASFQADVTITVPAELWCV